MSTRCQIGFYKSKEKKLQDFEVLIYRHSDGYPGKVDKDGKEIDYGVLADILPFLKWWKKARGLSDLEYVSARLLQYLCNKYDKQSKKICREIKSTYDGNEQFTGILGHGICKEFHWDIEYFYKIYPDAIEIYEARIKGDKFNPEEFKRKKTIEI